jgi:type II secretory pathway component PulF
MLRRPQSDRAAAYLLNDVASASDAGLSPDQILGGPSTAGLPGHAPPGVTLGEGLRRKGLELAPHELIQLEAAEHAGNVVATLRGLASARERRAERIAGLRSRLAYPILLFGCGIVFSLVISRLGPGGGIPPLVAIGTILALGAGTAVWLTRSVQHPTRPGGGLPLWSDVVRDWGQLPYLQAMHGLYRAGVKIVEAHGLATRASPVRAVRERLEEAGYLLSQDSPYAESMQRTGAADPDTLRMLAAGEASGDSEGALARAARRCEEHLDLLSKRLVRILVGVVVVVVYGYAAYYIVSFYLGYLGRLSGPR